MAHHYTYKDINSNEQVRLQKGMRLRFLSDWPAYEVTQIDTAGPSPLITFERVEPLPQYLQAAGLPDRFTATGGQNFIIGRQGELNGNGLTIKFGPISRTHSVLHFNASNGWYYSHYGRNSATIA